ncbi:zinc finger protein CONSTANS-LIKE 1 [Castanea sativa]|uniref:zinc finger protein CONSTANS-LIKE 1 n=1 Tax=Castanea sativa TaxID=21020 RepID=UPI003F64AA99
MSSDLYIFDDPLYRHSSSDMISSDGDLTFMSDSPIDIFQGISISDSQNYHNRVEESHSFDHFSPPLVSTSSPSQQLDSLNHMQTHNLQCLPNVSGVPYGFGNLSGLEGLEVKNEECQLGFESSFSQAFVPQSYSCGTENVANKFMQRSYSSNCFEGKPSFLFQPHFDTFMESQNFQNQALSPTENSFLAGQMRRVCSTGDLQNIKATHTAPRSYSGPLATESSFNEETNFKVGRYSAEERKERISKYRAKRTQRNFNKTIKYACRKTLADNRPRIRGRFARNDETGEIPKAACSTSIEDEEYLWLEGLHEANGTANMGQFVNGFGGATEEFQCYGF